MEGANEGLLEEGNSKEVGYVMGGVKARKLWGLWPWIERTHSTFEKQEKSAKLDHRGPYKLWSELCGEIS